VPTALSLLRRLVEHADRLSVVDGIDDVVRSRPVFASIEELLPTYSTDGHQAVASRHRQVHGLLLDLDVVARLNRIPAP